MSKSTKTVNNFKFHFFQRGVLSQLWLQWIGAVIKVLILQGTEKLVKNIQFAQKNENSSYQNAETIN